MVTTFFMVNNVLSWSTIKNHGKEHGQPWFVTNFNSMPCMTVANDDCPWLNMVKIECL